MNNKVPIGAYIFSVAIIVAICWLVCELMSFFIFMCFGLTWRIGYGTGILLTFLLAKFMLKIFE